MTSKNSRLRSLGETYYGFKVTRAVEIPELQCFLRELVHEKSGAQVMHLENEDPENLFCLSFQTIPLTSNGVAHILEHTVLCGSKKFPVKDPFFAMNRRSLNTFMNALTGADFTCYPAASQVSKDFYNLLSVYLDAVFHPNLNELSFLQEGHRIEFTEPSNPLSPLEYKGIVYNEMKGALASPSARLAEALNANLYPDVTYGINSGGEPKVIPRLTYEELKKFHQTFYHPSHCLFFFYGNMPLEKHLDFIAQQTLNQTEKAPPLPPIPSQPRFKEPFRQKLNYPIAPEEDVIDKTLIAFAWLTCHILEQEDALALSILEIMLMDTDASPLKMALLRSGWCKQANSFMDIELNEIPWGIILKGCNPDKADPFEELIKSQLSEIAHQGIPLQMIESAIHQLEFHRSEITGDHAPFGLSLFMRSGLLKQHKADPEQGLRIHTLFDQIRKRAVEDPLYFSRLIHKYFLNNTHFVRLVMKPDKNLGPHEIEEEKQVLEQIKSSLTEDQKQSIVQKAAKLADFQREQEEEDVDVLPKVHLSDIPPFSHDYLLHQEKIGTLEVFHHGVFTNDIVYADLVFDIPDLKEEDLPFLRLLTIVLTQVGAGERSYVENLDYIQSHTGGVGAMLNLNLQAGRHHQFSPTLQLKGKALHRKASKLFPLIQDIVNDAKLNDLNRLKEIIFKHFTSMESRFNQSVLKYAINLSASALNIPSKVANHLYGLNYYYKIRDIVRDFDQQGPYVLAKLQELQEQVLRPSHPHLVLSCNAATYNELKSHQFYGLQHLETSSVQPWKGNFSLTPVSSQGRIIASPVAFTTQVFATIPYIHPQTPALNVAAFMFDNLTLHRRIREQGGAYGAGAVNNSMCGNFYFYSYRDPNIVSTLKAFKESVHSLVNGDFDESDLEEAKFEMIQTLDSPISPGSQADLAYSWFREGRTLEIRQAFRQRMLNLTKEEVREAVEKVIVPNMDEGAIVTFAGQELLEKENEGLKAIGQQPLKIEKV